MEDNVYKPPKSAIIKEKEVPGSFFSGTFTAKKLKLLGWLALVSLLVDVPGFAISFIYGYSGGSADFKTYMHLFAVLSTVIWIYLLVQFRRFIVERFLFTKINWHVNLLIILAISLGLFSIVFVDGLVDPFSTESILFYLILIPYGVVSVLFGKRLLAIEYEYKFLRFFAWLFILAGVCTATVMLVLLAYLFGFVYTIAMAMIFFSGSKEMQVR